ncbi:MAG: ABC transporter ATP-binding protein [Pirellulaceae bacterium]
MIELREVTIRSGVFSLTTVNLTIPTGQYAVLMGGTGQGKTTILEAICGLKPVVSGRILLNGVDITQWKPADRGIGYVPQDLALFPTMTVREHLEFALRLRRVAASERAERVEELAEVLGIRPLLRRRMRGLSGGESQRVALGRALSFRPSVLLLDEPLNALDESTRDRLCELLRSVQRSTNLTTLHVTHSRDEARSVADALYVIAQGSVAERPLAMLDQKSETGLAAELFHNGAPHPVHAGSMPK